MSTNNSGNKVDFGRTTVVSATTSVSNVANSSNFKSGSGRAAGLPPVGSKINDFQSNYSSFIKKRFGPFSDSDEVKDNPELSDSDNSSKAIVDQQKTIETKVRLQKQLEEEEKLIEQEKELQKELYSGANVSPLWQRVIHEKKILYIR